MCGLMATGVQELEPTLAVVGAGAIELAGARAPQISDSRGTGAQQNLWGTCNCTKRPQILGPNIRQHGMTLGQPNFAR